MIIIMEVLVPTGSMKVILLCCLLSYLNIQHNFNVTFLWCHTALGIILHFSVILTARIITENNWRDQH